MRNDKGEGQAALMMRDVIAAISISLLLTLAAQLLARSEEPSTKAPTIMQGHDRHGFTLIEISIVLVIIGLIVGGVLVGQSLVQAAYVRATISQIEKYNQAANTFRGKYGYLPGDLPATVASQFGFFSNGMTGAIGYGDGNGVIQDISGDTNGGPRICSEPLVFWRHLSDSGLIDGNFGSNLTSGGCLPSSQSTAQLAQWVPQSKMGAWFFVYSQNGLNYYQLLAFDISPFAIGPSSVGGQYDADVVMTPTQAYLIDSKIDDGLPLSGTVQEQAGTGGAWFGQAPVVNDGCNVNGSSYAVSTLNAAVVACTLSFRFQ